MAVVPVRMNHAGMQETAAGAENTAAAGTETATVVMIMTIIIIMTVTEMIPVLNRDLMQDRLVVEKPAAVKRRTIEITEIQIPKHGRAFLYKGMPCLFA